MECGCQFWVYKKPAAKVGVQWFLITPPKQPPFRHRWCKMHTLAPKPMLFTTARSLNRKPICVYLPAVPTAIKTLSHHSLLSLHHPRPTSQSWLWKLSSHQSPNSMAKTGILGARRPLGAHRPTEPIPTSSTSLKHNKKVYVHISGSWLIWTVRTQLLKSNLDEKHGLPSKPNMRKTCCPPEWTFANVFTHCLVIPPLASFHLPT
jgi:hypothetical protein